MTKCHFENAKFSKREEAVDARPQDGEVQVPRLQRGSAGEPGEGAHQHVPVLQQGHHERQHAQRH